ncbi:endonuclease [Bacteroidales bacterium OttesenSCG-928-M11]|nr:endonuclease [Bacteroidales bacterium OttesenSCG-928-M11]
MKYYLLFFSLFLCGITTIQAQIPDGYYDSAYGKKKDELKTAMKEIIADHTVRTYNDLWTDFKKTDTKGNDLVWDMYSDGNKTGYLYYFGSDQCGNYKIEGDCYNREHSFPKSWFSEASPMYTDLFHLYPTDGYVNGRRSNHPFGEVGSASWTSSNGSKVGTSNFPGYKGTVFEPISIYKGDFARTYFYMATCYEDKITNWNSDMLAGNKYPAYTEWAKNLLLKWSRGDQVSQKEIDRNNAVYKIQGNRNPYIDFPQLAEYVWGDSIDYVFDPRKTIIPEPNPDLIVDFSGPWNLMPKGFESNSTDYSTDYSELRLNETGKYLIVAFNEVPDKLSFDMKAYNEWGDNENYVCVFESATNKFDEQFIEFGNKFLTTTETINSGPIQLSESSRYIKILYEKEAEDVSITNIKISRKKYNGWDEINQNPPIIYTANNTLFAANNLEGNRIRIYSLTGRLLSDSISNSDALSIALGNDKLYIVVISDKQGNTYTYKIINH